MPLTVHLTFCVSVCVIEIIVSFMDFLHLCLLPLLMPYSIRTSSLSVFVVVFFVIDQVLQNRPVTLRGAE